MRLEVSTRDECRRQTLSVQLFGSLRVLRNGQSIDGRLGGKARHLLKILAVNRSRRLPKELLMEMIWPERDPRAGAISLKVATHTLRTALDPTDRSPGRWIVVENGTYRLNPDADIWIDTEDFLAHYKHGRSSLATGSRTAARIEFEKAEELYDGDYLEEDMYEDWTVVRREALRDLYLDLIAKLATLSMEEGAYRDAIRYCHKILLADSCREDAYKMLIQSHGALNQIARAGSWYAVCRSTLQREIGGSPSPEILSAFEALFAGPQPVRGAQLA